ncbi:unnamed protein product, partial [Brachionus calyciflorus]
QLALEGYSIIKDFMPDDEKCSQMYKYFEKQLIKRIKPTMWNHYSSHTKTNNFIEGFHSSLNHNINRIHPNIFFLIGYLKDLQSNASIDYERLKQGQSIRKKCKQEEKDSRLEFLKAKYKDSESELNDTVLPNLTLNQRVNAVEEDQEEPNFGTYESSSLINLIAESNDLLNEQNDQPQNYQRNVTVDRRIRLATVLESIDDNDEDESFNYVNSLTNKEPLREISERNKAENEKLEAAVDARKKKLLWTK